MCNDFTIDYSQPRKPIEFHNFNVDWKVTCVNTGLEALKGARIKRIQEYIKTPFFLLTYGDGLSDIDINKLVDFHHHHGKIGTLSGVLPPSRFGDIEVKNNQVIKFSEKSQSSGGMINGGFFVFNTKLFDYLEDNDNCDFEFGPLEKLVEDKELMVYEHKGLWECMDNLRDIEHLNRLWKSDLPFWKVWDK
jgi:glucose-1-phosphate cytidylyltransferase